MPTPLQFAEGNDDDPPPETDDPGQQSKPDRCPTLPEDVTALLKRQHQNEEPQPLQPSSTICTPQPDVSKQPRDPPQDGLDDPAVPPRRAIPSPPRPQTFHRQESERRERLLEVRPSPTERRAASTERRRGLIASSAQRPSSIEPLSPLPTTSDTELGPRDQSDNDHHNTASIPTTFPNFEDRSAAIAPLEIPELDLGNRAFEPLPGDEEENGSEIDEATLREECEQKWILNLTMQFRDESDREKFFVTYAETPFNWRRVTVSVDYRNAPPDSLESDLKSLTYQRDKHFHIFQAIYESLPEIQWYEKVTNLILQTTPEDGQLHVHVHQDANEIVTYPSISLFGHVDSPRKSETDLELEAHLSGYVYKVRVNSKILIKKEIPGPDTIDEFLYEINALDTLDSAHVARLEGLVTDEDGEIVKGLLLAYASKGALVDILYDLTDIPWHRREKWAKQIVRGLSDIHEAGFVQGDFTLSNIVVDEADNAQIIDINRRGCPIGWEPPELSRLIDNGQRVSMSIGVKTDLFQLGMVLWALAEERDDPERFERPLPTVKDSVPRYFKDIIQTCLSDRPQDRCSAKELLKQFPPGAGRPGRPPVDFPTDLPARGDTDNVLSAMPHANGEHLLPDLAISLDDVNARNHSRNHNNINNRHAPPPRREIAKSSFNPEQVSYVDPDTLDLDLVDEDDEYDAEYDAEYDPHRNQHHSQRHSNPASTSYRFDSSGSWVVGRSPDHHYSNNHDGNNRSYSPFGPQRRDRSPSSTTSLSRDDEDEEPPSRSRRRCGSLFSDELVHERDGRGLHGGREPEEDDINAGDREDGEGMGRPTGTRARGVGGLEKSGRVLHKDSGFDEFMANGDHDRGMQESNLPADARESGRERERERFGNG